MNPVLLRFIALAAVLPLAPPTPRACAQSNPPPVPWTSPNQYRLILNVDARDRQRSNSPASIEIDFQSHLPRGQEFDEHTIEVVALVETGRAKVFDNSQPENDRTLVPHRIDRLFGATTATVNFVVPDHTCKKFAVYFDSVQSGRGQPHRYSGLVGDGDRFSEAYGRREINASHFDQFIDFDGDGDVDLFKGGVEPYVYCYENVGSNRLIARGRLASGGKLFTLPASDAHRSWVTVAFFDVDGDGDQDFFPSFGDGPDAGRIVFYKNTTSEHGGVLTFERVGILQTQSGIPLAGGPARGGWFPSITFVRNWDGGFPIRLDALVGSNHRCWLYRGEGANADGSPRFADAVAVEADSRIINLINPRFACADIDDDNNFDLFACTQPGAVLLFENVGTRTEPKLAAGRVVAVDGKYLIGDAHTGLRIADFNRDGLLDLLTGRFWERTDLNDPDQPRDYGGLYLNVGTKSQPRFRRSTKGAPFTEQFQICDAIRQNSVRSIDWDGDGKLDLLAGDTDGFIWLFRNETNQKFPRFAAGEKIRADGKLLSVAESGGHARFDIYDWNNDGRRDLLVADGGGTLTLFRGQDNGTIPTFGAGEKVTADGKPIQHGSRSSVLVCDWDNDGRKDIVFADDKGFYWHRNVGADESPVLSESKIITFGDNTARYLRPNLGSFVDWDGDGRRDFIGCEFENNIRLYRNIASGEQGTEPKFTDVEGVVLVRASSPQMISGAHAVDWNGDGDLDLLTGQGHGGSALRYFERDWIEDQLHDTHPIVTAGNVEHRPD
jgi:hypothetical protein